MMMMMTYSYTDLERPLGLQEVEAVRISRHECCKVACLITGRLYRPGNILGTHFC